MIDLASPLTLSPAELELAVKGILDAAGGDLASYQSQHLEPVQAHDGQYVIDVSIRFKALGADFRVLVECKHHRRAIERQDVQVLHSKVVATGAHKGMLFSTAGFQAGAVQFATAHGIALVQLVDGRSLWQTRSAGPPVAPPPWVDLPDIAGWLWRGDSRSVVSGRDGRYLREALGLGDPR